MNKLNGLLVACVLLAPGLASAATVNGELSVIATVGSGCTVNNSGGATADFGVIDFGEIYAFSGVDLFASTSGGSGGIEIECTAGTPYEITFDDGANPDSGSRNMVGASSGDLIAYELRWNDQNGPVIDPGVPITGNATGGVETFDVWGVIVATHPSVSADDYEDLVQVTVSW